LDASARFGPDHVSAYELTFEEGTRLTRRARVGRPRAPSDDVRADMFEATDEVLEGHGIARYEISNFARARRECRHNLGSWQGGDLAGVGASAASHVANARWSSVAGLDEWLRRVRDGEAPAEPAEVLDESTWAAEDLYLGLRTSEGVDAEGRLARVPAGERAAMEGALLRAERQGHLFREGRRVRLTRRGMLFADSIFETLLSP
jgi:oxygen-independent coproporphyrinogen-3 oxidase